MTEALKDTPEEKYTPTLNEFGNLVGVLKETNLKKAEGKFIEALKAKAASVNRSSQDKKKIAELYRKSKENFLKNYLIKFDVKILKQIKELEYDRFILIVGKDVELANSVATCIYCMYEVVFEPTEHTLSVENGEYTRRGISFCKHSYVGWDEAEIKEHLFSSKKPLINHFKENNMLFLRGINDTKILARLADTVRNETWGKGILVINVPSVNIVPQDLKDQFEVIELEPEKQGEITSKKIPRGQKQVYVDQNILNKLLIGIIKGSPNLSNLQLAKKAITKMKTEKHFLDGNGNPLYKESTLKNKIHKLLKGLKHTISSFSKLKNDGKVTVKKRHLKSDVKT